MRKIIHIDMDCFYAAIECRDDPSLQDKPIGVGGSNDRGVLTTCNYPAREYGLHSAMPVFKAKQLCPGLILKPVRFEVYREESRQIRDIFREYTEVIEPLSLDEAYLDVSHLKRYAWDVAKEIRQKIWKRRRLRASAGVGANKMLAKIASDWRKPDGQFAILPDDVEKFMRVLPVRKIPGVGPKAEAKLKELGVETCGDLHEFSKFDLSNLFGPATAEELYNRCRGFDDRPVEVDRLRKSVSVERTFNQDLESVDACRDVLPELLDELRADVEKRSQGRLFYKLFIKIKFSNFQSTTRECAGNRLDSVKFDELLEEAFHRSPHSVRLIGVGVRFREVTEENQLEFSF